MKTAPTVAEGGTGVFLVRPEAIIAQADNQFSAPRGVVGHESRRRKQGIIVSSPARRRVARDVCVVEFQYGLV